LQVQLKHPDAKRPFGIDWSAWCARFGDTIASATWEVPDGLTSHGDAVIGNVAIVVLSGGESGDPLYEVACHIVSTENAYEDEAVLPLKIEG
jgi:hypothetical protein